MSLDSVHISKWKHSNLIPKWGRYFPWQTLILITNSRIIYLINILTLVLHLCHSHKLSFFIGSNINSNPVNSLMFIACIICIDIPNVSWIVILLHSGCEVADWTTWSDCSEDCGPGTMSRSREYVYESDNDNAYCDRVLQETVSCTNINPCSEGNAQQCK